MECFKELIRKLIFPFIGEEIVAENGTLKARFFHWLYGEPSYCSDTTTGRVYPADYDFNQDPWNRSQGVDHE